jgi:hypothetical protein
MRLIFRGATLLLLGALACSTLPAADDKPGDKSDKKDTGKTATKTKAKEKFEYGTPPLQGKLTKLEGSTKNFTVQVTYMVQDPQRTLENANWYNQQLASISGEKNPLRRNQRLAQLQVDVQQRAANAMKKATKDVDLQGDENMKVRIVQPPIEYDDKGNAKKHTKAELAALKGPDKNLPGYTSDYDQLRTGQYVQVYPPKAKQKTKTTDKTAPKAEDPDAAVERPKAVMILIVADPSAK